MSDFLTRLIRIFIITLKKIPKMSREKKKKKKKKKEIHRFIIYSNVPFGRSLCHAETSQLILYVR